MFRLEGTQYQKRAASQQQTSWRSQFEKQAKEDHVKVLLASAARGNEGGCRERFQQTDVTVYASFLAEDPDSGRREYFISRTTLLDVTDIVVKHLRVTDPRVATLLRTTLIGVGLGKTEVVVASPLTGRDGRLLQTHSLIGQ